MAFYFRVINHEDLFDEKNVYYILKKSSSQLGTIYAIPVGNYPVRAFRKEITFMEKNVFPEFEGMGIDLLEVGNVVFDQDKMIVRLLHEEDLKKVYRDFFIVGDKFNYSYISTLIFNPPVVFSFSGPTNTTRSYAEKLREEGYKVIDGEI